MLLFLRAPVACGLSRLRAFVILPSLFGGGKGAATGDAYSAGVVGSRELDIAASAPIPNHPIPTIEVVFLQGGFWLARSLQWKQCLSLGIMRSRGSAPITHLSLAGSRRASIVGLSRLYCSQPEEFFF